MTTPEATDTLLLPGEQDLYDLLPDKDEVHHSVGSTSSLPHTSSSIEVLDCDTGDFFTSSAYRSLQHDIKKAVSATSIPQSAFAPSLSGLEDAVVHSRVSFGNVREDQPLSPAAANRDKRQAIAIIEGAVELAEAARKIVKLVEDGAATINSMANAYDELKKLYHRFFSSEPTLSGYDQDQKVKRLMLGLWVSVEDFAQFLNYLRTLEVAVLNERTAALGYWHTMIGQPPPFSTVKRFPSDGLYCLLTWSGIDTQMCAVKNMLNFRLYNGLENEWLLHLQAYGEAVDELFNQLDPTSKLEDVCVFDREKFERVYGLTFDQ